MLHKDPEKSNCKLFLWGLAIAIAFNIAPFCSPSAMAGGKFKARSNTSTNASKEVSAAEAMRELVESHSPSSYLSPEKLLEKELLDTTNHLDLSSVEIGSQRHVQLVLRENQKNLRDLSIICKNEMQSQRRDSEELSKMHLQDTELGMRPCVPTTENLPLLQSMGYRDRSVLESSILEGLPGQEFYLDELRSLGLLSQAEMADGMNEKFFKMVLEVASLSPPCAPPEKEDEQVRLEGSELSLEVRENNKSEGRQEFLRATTFFDNLKRDVVDLTVIQQAVKNLEDGRYSDAVGDLKRGSNTNKSPVNLRGQSIAKLRSRLTLLAETSDAIALARFKFSKELDDRIEEIFEQDQDSLSTFKILLVNELFKLGDSHHAISWFPPKAKNRDTEILKTTILKRLTTPMTTEVDSAKTMDQNPKASPLFQRELEDLKFVSEQQRQWMVVELIIARGIVSRALNESK